MGGGGGVGWDQRAGDGDVDGGDRGVGGEEGDDEVDLRAGPPIGAGEVLLDVEVRVEVSGGGLADDLGEAVMPPDEPTCGSTGELVVGVDEQRADGVGEGGLVAGAVGARCLLKGC